jgi:hypothetical protein
MTKPMFGIAFRNIDKFNKDLHAIDNNVNRATVLAIRANQNLIKKMLRAKLTSYAPRWNHRGASRIYPGMNITFKNLPKYSKSGGPPGKFTGALVGGVGSVKRIKKTAGFFDGGVGIGGNANNLKKNTLERKFPYFAPTVIEAIQIMANT